MKNMKKKSRLTMPRATWTLAKLGRFCRASAKDLALYGWRLGKALNLVKEKLKHGEFENWAAKNCPGVSKATYSRYMRVAAAYDRRDLAGKRLMELYRELGMVADAPAAIPAIDTTPADRVPLDDDASNADSPIIPLPAPPPALHDEPEEVVVEEEELLERESCEEFISDVIRPLSAKLITGLDELFTFRPFDRQRAWRAMDCDAVREQVIKLAELLNRVEKDMPATKKNQIKKAG